MNKAQIIVASCSRRSLELEQVKDYLKGNGYSISKDDWQVDREADLIVLSTCGFTGAAEKFGFETLQQVQEQKANGAKVIFGGCIPEINPERVLEEFDGPTISPQRYEDLDEIIGAKRKFNEFKRPNTIGKSGLSALANDLREVKDIISTFDGSLAGLEYIGDRLGNGFRQRLIRKNFANLNSTRTFYIQLQEGCSMKCSYCVIRTAIGALRSRPMDEILTEFNEGLSAGFERFQLMGDNAGSYGLDLGTNLGKLLERILEIEGDYKLDLTDINPVYLKLIVKPVLTLCQEKKISSLYIPVQSSSRRILKLMGRDCDMDLVQEHLSTIKSVAPPKFRMGTSIIVGFPSETEAEMRETIDYCRSVDFDWVWTHNFSARQGTPAAILQEQLPAEEIDRRTSLVKASLGSKMVVTTPGDKEGNKTCQG